ncbi:MAG: alanine:cation symporter family protein [Rhabdochlamydiaceae bacterium]|nr:alanine:cation symporter family protein [Rhabdochlamydiaceae bacterium]
MLESFVKTLADHLLFVMCVFILGSSIYLSIKTRFIQVRLLPLLLSHLKGCFNKGNSSGSKHSLPPYKALFTAMSTTIGISSIVGPVIAIRLGGPGALLGFLLTAFFGSAATYLEVHLSVLYRKKLPDGRIMGGPMQYLSHLLSPRAAKWYAGCCMILMMVWSAAQANQLSAVLSSPSLGKWQISPIYSGMAVSILVGLTLLGGVRRVGSFSAKLVPVMFLLYLGSSFWIIGSNLDQLGKVFTDVFTSAFSPYALASGSLVGGTVAALRWGIFKGVNATEAGLGTQTIPHSLAETTDPRAQGALAMVSTFSAGALTFLSGCVALITQTWQDPSLPLGISMVTASYQQYFSVAGVVVVSIIAFLFGFGTILGNSFNGGQCYGYLTQNRKQRYYILMTLVMICLGSLGEVQMVWSLVDIVLCFMAVPHMFGLFKGVRLLKEQIKLA